MLICINMVCKFSGKTQNRYTLQKMTKIQNMETLVKNS